MFRKKTTDFENNYIEIEQRQSFARSVVEFVVELVKVIFVSLAIIIPVRYFLIQPFYVKGASMEPNFYNNEYLIIDEISYRFKEPERGDIIVFKYPFDHSQYFIKRIIGLPGETVELKDGKVIVYNSLYKQGVEIDESAYIVYNMTKTSTDKKIRLGEDEYFVLGDNRDMSLDSRSFGPISSDLIIGKVWFRGWPFNRIKVFKTPNYVFK